MQPPDISNFTIQAIGAIAFLIGLISYQCLSQKKMYAMCIISNLIWAVHYFLLGAWSAGFSVIIGNIRVLLIVFIAPHYRVPIIAVAALCSFLFCAFSPEESLLRFAPFVATCFFSIGLYYHENFLKSRFFIFITTLIWFLYGFEIGSYIEIFSGAFNMVSIVIGIARHTIQQKNIKQHA